MGSSYGINNVSVWISDDEANQADPPIRIGQGWDWVPQGGDQVRFLAQRLDNGDAPLEASFILIDQAGGDNQTATLSWEANDLSTKYIEGTVNRNPDQAYGVLVNVSGGLRGIGITYEALIFLEDASLDEDGDGIL